MIAAACNAIWPDYGRAFLDCLGSVYPGFSENGTLMSIIGDTAYGLVDGAVAGALLAWLYNMVAARDR